MNRTLDWDGCINVRDLGGLPLADGGTTAPRVLVRADDVAGLSDDGWRALSDYGVSRVVDLRWREEPPHVRDGLDIVSVPLLGDSRGAAYRAKYDAYLDAADPVEWYRWSYLEFLVDYRSRFGRAVAALASAPGPAVFHCAGGKDRTGLVSALVLGLAGVPTEAIVEDWVLSEASWAPSTPAWVDDAPDETERRRRGIYSLCPRAAMVAVLAALESRYGGARRYLEAAGVRRVELDGLQARLRGEEA